MAITASATKVFSRTGLFADSSTYGIIAQASDCYLFGSSQPQTSFPFPTAANWYKSTNNGTTWTPVSSTNGLFGAYSSFPCNVHQNFALAAVEQPAASQWDLLRSADNGASWATVFTCATASSPNGRFVYIWGAQSFNRTSAVIYGALDGNKTNPQSMYAVSTNNGASFTLAPPFDSGDPDDGANAFGLAENGFWWMQYTLNGGINRKSYLARTENYGATWTRLLEMRTTDGAFPAFGTAICALDQQNILVAATNTVNPTASIPGLWWSSDAGDSLTPVDASDILNWPTGAFYSTVQEVKRLTADSVFLAFDQQNGTPGSPWRISLDKGHTFPIEVNLTSGSFPAYVIPFGKVTVARDGAILASTWESADYSDVQHCVYRINVNC